MDLYVIGASQAQNMHTKICYLYLVILFAKLLFWLLCTDVLEHPDVKIGQRMYLGNSFVITWKLKHNVLVGL